MLRNSLNVLSLLVVLTALVGSSAGNTLVFGTEIVDVDAFGAFTDNVLPEFAINGSGLTGGEHSSGGIGQTWAAGELQNFATLQAFNGNPSPSLNNPLNWYSITLDQIRPIESIRLWNYNEAGTTTIGIKNFQVYTSENGVSYNLALTDVLPQAPGTPGYTGTSFALGGASAAVVLIEAIDNYGATSASTGDLSGLSEIQLTQVPEPASFTTILLGLGCLLFGFGGLRCERCPSSPQPTTRTRGRAELSVSSSKSRS